jgi:DDE_Tnp_1-associated
MIITGAVPAVSSSLTVLAAGHLDALACRDPVPGEVVPAGLLDALAQVPDPRDPRGIRYDLVPVFALAVCATMAGARSFAAIAEWAGDAGVAGRAGPARSGPGPVPPVNRIWQLACRSSGVRRRAYIR